MTKRDAKAGGVVLRGVLTTLLAMPTDQRTEEAADLRRRVGALSALAEDRILESDIGTDLLACFEAARLAGATFVAMGRIERYLATADLTRQSAILVAVTALRLAAVQRARIVAGTDFRSRSEVDLCQRVLNASFDAVIEYAADVADQEAYRTLTALFAAVTRDLQQRSRPLPRMSSYAVGGALPSLALANRLYGDADRADELKDENRVPHPLFMPLSGQALSA